MVHHIHMVIDTLGQILLSPQQLLMIHQHARNKDNLVLLYFPIVFKTEEFPVMPAEHV